MTKKNLKNLPYFLLKLPNGFQVVFWPLRGIEVVAMALWIKTGSWYETNLKKGIFHFLEHILVQGTQNYPSFRKLSEKQESLGLRMNNSVAGEVSSFQWSLPKENFSEGLELLAEYVFNPLLPRDGIERERRIILQEYQDFWDSPYNRFWSAFSKIFWGENHPYTFDSLGTKEGIATITKDDLLKIHQKWYQPQNMTLVVVGDLEKRGVEEKINKTFRAKPNTSFQPKLLLPKPKFRKKFFFFPENFKQITFGLSFPVFGYKEREKKEQIALNMVFYILIGSRWSRLSLRLREKEPLAYSLWGSLRFYPQGGFFDLYASFSPENTRKILKAVKEEVEKIKTKGIEQKEFERAKKYFLYQSTMSFDSVYDIAFNLITYLFQEGKVFLPEDGRLEINRVKKKDLKKIAGEILILEKSTTGIMGQQESLAKLQDLVIR